MCEVCRFEPPSHAPWCPIKDQDALREMARKKAENFQRIAELESENSKLKVAVEHARSDALSNLERLISVEAENKRLMEALRDIEVACNICGLPEPRGIPLGALSESVHEIARRALGGEG